MVPAHAAGSRMILVAAGRLSFISFGAPSRAPRQALERFTCLIRSVFDVTLCDYQCLQVRGRLLGASMLLFGLHDMGMRPEHCGMVVLVASERV